MEFIAPLSKMINLQLLSLYFKYKGKLIPALSTVDTEEGADDGKVPHREINSVRGEGGRSAEGERGKYRQEPVVMKNGR
jgi:hypothetical protein